jgi:hypothetical protein
MATKIRVRKDTRVKNWFVFLDKNTGELSATEDLHDGYLMQMPQNLKCIGCPVERTAKDAVNYVEQVLGPVRMAEWRKIWK